MEGINLSARTVLVGRRRAGRPDCGAGGRAPSVPHVDCSDAVPAVGPRRVEQLEGTDGAGGEGAPGGGEPGPQHLHQECGEAGGGCREGPGEEEERPGPGEGEGVWGGGRGAGAGTAHLH